MRVKAAISVFCVVFAVSFSACAQSMTDTEKLFTAIKSNYTDGVQQILKTASPDLTKTDKAGRTPLRLAVEAARRPKSSDCC